MFKRIIKKLVGVTSKPETPKTNNVLDWRWYEKMRDFGSFQAYKFFEGNNLYRDQQKKMFFISLKR